MTKTIVRSVGAARGSNRCQSVFSMYVTGVHPQPNLSDHLEKEVELDSKKYDILGATYYGGSRFQFRYFLSPGVFDSRKEILADYREAFAGSFVDDGVRYQIYDVYYRQRSDEYEDDSNGQKCK